MKKALFVLMAAALLCSVAMFVGCSENSGPVASGPDAQIMAPKAPKTALDAPVIACGENTDVSIYIEVCAGASGAPAGFSLQWVPAEYHALYGWPASDSPDLCKASFSGNANNSNYNLGAGECVTVNVGELLLDNGASTTCAEALLCGTEYVFRAFAHATSSANRSAFTANLTCSTESDCETQGGCTYTQGYWKNHGPEGCQSGNNDNEWPQVYDEEGNAIGTADVTLCDGTVLTAEEACAILNTPGPDYALLHQQIAAALNVANGATPPADEYCGSIHDLTAYNEGDEGYGPGHCN